MTPGIMTPDIMTPGITTHGTGMDGIAWNILGQTYVPLQRSDASMSWHATFPPGTFVPPHAHATQDEFVYVLTGTLEADLVGDTGVDTQVAGPGDLIRLPMHGAHGLFNRSGATVTCLFWVAPTGQLWDLFTAIDGVPDPAEIVRLAALHDVDFLPPSAS